MSTHDPMGATVPAPLLDVTRRLTEGSVSARHHAASRARVFDRCAALPRKGRSTTRILGLVFIPLLLTGATGSAALIGMTRVRAPASATTASTVESPKPELPRLEIDVDPPEAQIYWDDVLVEGNPAVVTGPDDHKRHTVRAEAPGYATASNIVKLSGYRSISFELRPEPLELGPITATGPVPDAKDVFERLREPLRACLEIDLVGDVPIAGTATIALGLSSKGVVTDVSVEQVHGFSTRGLACLEAVPRSAQFSTFGKPQKLSVPVTFRARPRKGAK
jgi:hypothetical protein